MIKMIKVKHIKTDDSREVIICTFTKGKKKGSFSYRLFGIDDDIGIECCNYNESPKEDIYADIHYWTSKHIETRRSIKLDGKEIK